MTSLIAISSELLRLCAASPNDESNVSWKRVSHFDLKGLLSNISIFIDADTVKVTCTEDQNARVKVSDVLLGPFNL